MVKREDKRYSEYTQETKVGVERGERAKRERERERARESERKRK